MSFTTLPTTVVGFVMNEDSEREITYSWVKAPNGKGIFICASHEGETPVMTIKILTEGWSEQNVDRLVEWLNSDEVMSSYEVYGEMNNVTL